MSKFYEISTYKKKTHIALKIKLRYYIKNKKYFRKHCRASYPSTSEKVKECHRNAGERGGGGVVTTL